MGFFSSKSTQKTTYDPKIGDQLEWEDLQKEQYFAGLEAARMDIEEKEITKYANEQEANKIKSQISNADAQIYKLEQDLKAFESNPPMQKGSGAYGAKREELAGKIGRMKADKSIYEGQLASQKQVTYTDYTLVKREDPRIENMMYENANKNGEVDRLVSQYGMGSKEVKDFIKQRGDGQNVTQAREQIRAEEGNLASLESSAQKEYLTNVNKILAGDIEPNEETKAQIKEMFAPIANVIKSATADMMAQADSFGTNMMAEWQKIGEEIDKTGFDVFSALEAAAVQVEKSGKTLLSVVEDVNKSEWNKAKFEFDLLSRKADESSAKQMALLGLAPGSEQEKARSAKMKQEALAGVLLNLEERAAGRALGIQGATEQGKIDISLARVNLAENQGAKKEALAKLGFDTKSFVEQTKLGIKGAEAQGLIDLSKAEAETGYNVGYGNIATALGATGGALNLGRGNATIDQGLALGGAGIAASAAGAEQAARAGQATVTTTSNPSLFSSIASGIGTGIGAATGLGSIGAYGNATMNSLNQRRT